MKKLAKLKEAKALGKKQQQNIYGGRPPGGGPCGGTGGIVIGGPQESCFGYGVVWYNNQCWACY
jgi:hypothetical protein